MATLHQILSTLSGQIIGAITDAAPSLDVKVGIDFPPQETLMKNVRGGTVIVAVMDNHTARNTTRWNPIVLSTTLVPATLSTAISNSSIGIGGTEHITLGGTVGLGDAVSCVLANQWALGHNALTSAAYLEADPGGSDLQSDGGSNLMADTGLSPFLTDTVYTPTWAQVAVGVALDTPTTMATKLAALVNADAILSSWVQATASGPQVSLANLTGNVLTLASYAGNGGTQNMELARRNRSLHIIVWARSIEDRDTVGDIIDALLAQIEVFAGTFTLGLAFPDGSGGRLSVDNDFLLDNSTPADTYRRDFIASVDYPITTTDRLYAILAPIIQFQLGYNA